MKRYRWNQNGLAGNIFMGDSFGAIVLASPGLPYVPGAQPYFTDLIDRGYLIVQPQYIGTYDSEGKFSPAGAIRTVRRAVEEIKTGIYDTKSGDLLVAGDIDVAIGHSFGSWVLLNSMANLVSCSTIILLSPFLAMGKYQSEVGVSCDLSKQVSYISAALPYTFRLSSTVEWEEFFGNGDFPLPSDFGPGGGRIIFAAGMDDQAFDIDILKHKISLLAEKIPSSDTLFFPVEGAGHDATQVFHGCSLINLLDAG